MTAVPALAAGPDPATTGYLMNTLLLLISGALVMFMAAGFAMLEAGSVRGKSVTAICAKNLALYALLLDDSDLACVADPPSGGFGAECQSVYYPRLLRDRWTLAEPINRAGWIDRFEKPLAHGWTFVKLARCVDKVTRPTGRRWPSFGTCRPAPCATWISTAVTWRRSPLRGYGH